MNIFSKILKYIHSFLVTIFMLLVIYVVYKVIDLQSIFSASYSGPGLFIYFVIIYLYIWWFTKFENFEIRFWKTEKKALHAIFIKFIYFSIFIFEVVISIFIATNFDKLFLQVWAFLVGVLLFFMLFKLRKYIESQHETYRLDKFKENQVEQVGLD